MYAQLRCVETIIWACKVSSNGMKPSLKFTSHFTDIICFQSHYNKTNGHNPSQCLDQIQLLSSKILFMCSMIWFSFHLTGLHVGVQRLWGKTKHSFIHFPPVSILHRMKIWSENPAKSQIHGCSYWGSVCTRSPLSGDLGLNKIMCWNFYSTNYRHHRFTWGQIFWQSLQLSQITGRPQIIKFLRECGARHKPKVSFSSGLTF